MWAARRGVRNDSGPGSCDRKPSVRALGTQKRGPGFEQVVGCHGSLEDFRENLGYCGRMVYRHGAILLFVRRRSGISLDAVDNGD